jgi:hypothetical protein
MHSLEKDWLLTVTIAAVCLVTECLDGCWTMLMVLNNLCLIQMLLQY